MHGEVIRKKADEEGIHGKFFLLSEALGQP